MFDGGFGLAKIFPFPSNLRLSQYFIFLFTLVTSIQTLKIFFTTNFLYHFSNLWINLGLQVFFIVFPI